MENWNTRLAVEYFFSYPKETKCQSFYNPRERKAFVSTNVLFYFIFLENDGIMDQRPNSQIVLGETQGKSIPDPRITEFCKDTPNLELFSTPLPHRNGKVVWTPNRFMFLRKSGKTILKVQEQDPTTYHKAITTIALGGSQNDMKAEMESVCSNYA